MEKENSQRAYSCLLVSWGEMIQRLAPSAPWAENLSIGVLNLYPHLQTQTRLFNNNRQLFNYSNIDLQGTHCFISPTYPKPKRQAASAHSGLPRIEYPEGQRLPWYKEPPSSPSISSTHFSAAKRQTQDAVALVLESPNAANRICPSLPSDLERLHNKDPGNSIQKKEFLISGRVRGIFRKFSFSQIQPPGNTLVNNATSAPLVLMQTTLRDANLVHNNIGHSLHFTAPSFMESPVSVHCN